MAKFYTDRFAEKSALSLTDNLLSQSWPQPLNFSLGSCGGFSTADEMIAQIDLMRSLYPNLISAKKALSDTVSTIEGRTVYYIRISDNPDVNESEPEVLYTGMHHAREPVSMQHLLYYMWYLLENYNSDSTVKALVDHTEMYFVPIFNVDGYTYNITTNPNGGGMWRKNRRDNGSGYFGVDINRNYGYKWGNDNSGSSPDPWSDLYRGTAPFSEPETRMMKYFCEDHNFLIALNYHSYSNLLLYPWGWTADPSPDNVLLENYAVAMTQENNYTYGPGSTTIYPTNGGSDDWMYGEQTTKPLILSYTPEIGSYNDGFWPQQSRILPLIQENMLASITAAKLVGNYAWVTDDSPLFIYEASGYLPFKVKRLGQQNGSFTVSVYPVGSSFTSVGEAKNFENMNLLEKRTDSIAYQLSNALNVGDTLYYVLAINNGYFTEYDTVRRIFGYPVAVFDDKLSDNTNWTGTWALTNWQSYSPSTSMTDSPNANYSASDNKTITMVNEIDLPVVMNMVLQFRAKWDLEKDYDYVQLSLSVNNGTTWIPLQGKYTHTGTVYQANGQPVYDGKKGEWVREEISLNNYMGQKIKLRFKLKADQGKEFDGFYFDDVNISMLLDPTSMQNHENGFAVLGNPFPNPADNRFEISYILYNSASTAELNLLTPAGVVVMQKRIHSQAGTEQIDVSSLAPGLYFIRIVADGIPSTVKKLIVR